jgi:hypothetical protein
LFTRISRRPAHNAAADGTKAFALNVAQEDVYFTGKAQYAG